VSIFFRPAPRVSVSAPLRMAACAACHALTATVELKAEEARRLEADLAEFQEVSRELERALHSELDALERQHRDLQLTANKLAADNTALQSRLHQLCQDNNARILALELEVERREGAQREWVAERRSLEQRVDDLQRKERELLALSTTLAEELEQEREAQLFLQCALESARAEAEAEQHAARRLQEDLRDTQAELSSKAHASVPIKRLSFRDEVGPPRLNSHFSAVPAMLSMKRLSFRDEEGLPRLNSHSSGVSPRGPDAIIAAYRLRTAHTLQSCADTALEATTLLHATTQRADLLQTLLEECANLLTAPATPPPPR